MSRIARILGQLRPQSAAVSTGAAFSDDAEAPASAHVVVSQLTNGLTRLTVGASSADLTNAEAAGIGKLLLQAASAIHGPAEYISRGADRHEGEMAPCPLCCHSIPAREADLYLDAVYIDSASQLAALLKLTGQTRGLQVRAPTMSTRPGWLDQARAELRQAAAEPRAESMRTTEVITEDGVTLARGVVHFEPPNRQTGHTVPEVTYTPPRRLPPKK